MKQLNATNVTEDEKFIFEYLNKKRERQTALGLNGEQHDTVDDDEFDAYLESLGGKGKKKDDGIDDEEFDFMGDFGEGQANKPDADDEDWDDDDDGDDDDDDEEGNESKKHKMDEE